MATYTVLISRDLHNILAFKATGDPANQANWTNVGDNVFPTPGSLIIALSGFELNEQVHVAAYHLNGRISYHLFDFATDSWTIRDEEVLSPLDGTVPPRSRLALSIGVRSDGDVIIGYTRGALDSHYARRESGVWTIEVVVITTGSVQEVQVVMGASDRAHFLSSASGGDSKHRSLSSTNVLDTEQNVGGSGLKGALRAAGRGVSFEVANETRIRIPGSGSTQDFVTYEFDSEADPTVPGIVTVSTTNVKSASDTGLLCLASDGATTHAIWVRETDDDIDRDSRLDGGSWGTDSLVVTGTVTFISANVYDRNGSKLGVLYNDSGTIKLVEVDLNLSVDWDADASTLDRAFAGPFEI